jgi:asparagine synthase (glutamine-hydrolysing)
MVLGSVRLAILDLTPAGHMPMTSEDGRFSLVYNGEITNYVEVREELVALGHTFSTHTDTEVLLQAWVQWGRNCLDRFEGMFAFAILDRSQKRLTLARDVFGIKPLFYAMDGGELVFCSELPGLLALRERASLLDWQTAVDYLRFGLYEHSHRTFVEGVHRLEPAHTVTLDLDTGRLQEPERYWWPSVLENGTMSFSDAADEVRERFLASVRMNLRSDVPVGVALSGGIDSSAILAAVRHVAPAHDLQAFSFVAPGFAKSEEHWIDLMVEATGARSFRVQASSAELSADLDRMIRMQGEPFRSTSIYAQYRVFQLARENGIVVTLDGQGADEMFAGYDGYLEQRVRSMVDRGQLLRANEYVNEWAAWPGRSVNDGRVRSVAAMTPRPLAVALERARRGQSIIDRDALRDRGISLDFPRERPGAPRGRRLVAMLRRQLMTRGLPALLRHGDRNAMAFSIESRVPFLDRGLTELALSLPEHYLVSQTGETKSVFRAAMRGIVPDAVLDRRDKIGFETPETDWLTGFAGQHAELEEEPIAFLPQQLGKDRLTDDALGFGGGGTWRYLNLRRWVTLFGVDAR